MRDFIKEIETVLKPVTEEYKAEARLIIEAIENKNQTEILRDNIISHKKEILKIAKLRTETIMPIQYLLGFAYFMGEKFFVDENVLIPRVETEILVREAIKKIKNNDKILEIGTGSGCIACMLSKMFNQELQILATDISTAALKIALKNAEKMVEANRVIFRKSDIFSNVKEKFNIIVSNPPYVPLNFKIQKELEFEPKNALFAENDGLYFYEKIIEEAKNHLEENGYIFFECGENQAQKIKKIFEKYGFKNIQTAQDLAKIERVIYANC